MAAGFALGAGLIAGDGEAVVHAELRAPADDVGLAELDERCMHVKTGAFDASPGRQIG